MNKYQELPFRAETKSAVMSDKTSVDKNKNTSNSGEKIRTRTVSLDIPRDESNFDHDANSPKADPPTAFPHPTPILNESGSTRSLQRRTSSPAEASAFQDRLGISPSHSSSWTPGQEIAKEEKQSWKSKLWNFVDVPSSSIGANIFSILIMVLIILSVITFCIETLPIFHKKYVTFWWAFETICIAIFTIEFILRIISAPNTCKFMYDAYTIIDIVAILPYYVELVFDLADGQLLNNLDDQAFSSSFLRVFRLLRVLRVFKMARYLSWMKLFTVSIKQSLPPLGMFSFFVGIVVIVFATIMYYLERGVWTTIDGESFYVNGVGSTAEGETSKFSSIPDSIYWCIITMTTVGYGDMYPTSTLGKLIAALASLTGIFVLAIPITIISSNFNREYEKEKKERAEAHAKMQMIKNHFSLKKKGFIALSEEIENMVTHKTAVYKKKIGKLIDKSRVELIDEIEELIKLAYQCRVENDKKNKKRADDRKLAQSDSS